MEEFLEVMFSEWPMVRLYNEKMSRVREASCVEVGMNISTVDL
jgi:hypothetical protein